MRLTRSVALTAAGLLALAAPPLVAPLHAQTLTLADAVEAALEHHPAIASADARAEGARDDVDLARAARWPRVGAELSLDRFQEPMVATPIHGFDPTRLPPFDRTLVQGRLGLAYTLFDGGERGSAVDASSAEAEAVALGAVTTRQELIVRVSEAFVRAVGARAVDAAAAARVASLEAEADRAQRGVEAGSSAQVELVRASAALQDARAARTTSQAAARLAERDLARLMGVAPEALVGAPLVEPSVGPALTESGGPDTSPAVLRAERRAEVARARHALESAGRWPRLDATGALLDFGPFQEYHTAEWQVGVRASWSVFTGGARSARIGRTRAELEAAERDVDRARLDAASALDAARTAIESADARVLALEASVAQWDELVRIEALALGAGSGVQRDLLDAEAGRFRARASLVEARGEATLARIRLAATSGVLDRALVRTIQGSQGGLP